MGLTRGQVLNRVVSILGDDSAVFRTYLAGSFNHVMHSLYDMHDWEWKHTSGTFNTVVGTESYDLSIPSPRLRSAQDIECMWDKTNGRFIHKTDLRDIRKHWPKEDTSGQPTNYAPWGLRAIVLTDEPDGIYTINFLHVSKAIEATDDADDIETDLGIPDFIQYLLEKMVLAEGMLYYDDNRRAALLGEIGTPAVVNSLMFNAIAADMNHLDSGARFKFWEEELRPTSLTYNDFLRRTWVGA